MKYQVMKIPRQMITILYL